jgi:hypothetical protein
MLLSIAMVSQHCRHGQVLATPEGSDEDSDEENGTWTAFERRVDSPKSSIKRQKVGESKQQRQGHAIPALRADERQAPGTHIDEALDLVLLGPIDDVGHVDAETDTADVDADSDADVDGADGKSTADLYTMSVSRIDPRPRKALQRPRSGSGASTVRAGGGVPNSTVRAGGGVPNAIRYGSTAASSGRGAATQPGVCPTPGCQGTVVVLAIVVFLVAAHTCWIARLLPSVQSAVLLTEFMVSARRRFWIARLLACIQHARG